MDRLRFALLVLLPLVAVGDVVHQWAEDERAVMVPAKSLLVRGGTAPAPSASGDALPAVARSRSLVPDTSSSAPSDAGTAGRRAPLHPEGPAKELAALCKLTEEHACGIDKSIPFEGAGIAGEVADVSDEVCGTNHVYLRTQAGWYRLGVAAGRRGCGDPVAGTSTELDGVQVANGVVVFRLRSSHWVAPPQPDNPGIPGPSRDVYATEQTYACREVAGALQCGSFTTATATVVRKGTRSDTHWTAIGRVVVSDAGVASVAASAD